VLARLLEQKKNRKPDLKSILKKAIAKMRIEQKKNNQNGKRKSKKHDIADKVEEDDPNRVIYQPIFFDDAADDLHVYAKFHDRAVNKVFDVANQYLDLELYPYDSEYESDSS
jgi:hypothetical protein